MCPWKNDSHMLFDGKKSPLCVTSPSVNKSLAVFGLKRGHSLIMTTICSIQKQQKKLNMRLAFLEFKNKFSQRYFLYKFPV